MKRTLLKLLLAVENEPAETIATELGITPSCLSRTASGLLKKPSVLRRLAEYYSKVGGEYPVDSDLLTQEITARGLILLATYARKNLLFKDGR